jgi:hypothetical protein
MKLPIKVGDGELEHRRKRNPSEVGEIDIGHPWCQRKDGDECPGECDEDEENVDSSEKIALKAELQRCEGKIKKEIQGKRERNHPWVVTAPNVQEDVGERDSNEYIEYGPDRSKQPGGRCPGGFGECSVPGELFHMAKYNRRPKALLSAACIPWCCVVIWPNERMIERI